MRLNAAALLIVAAVGLGLLWYPTARDPTTCEKFITGVAIDFVLPEWCNRVPLEASAGSDGFAAKGFEVSSLRSECFLAIAVKTNDVELCKEVKPISSGLAQGMLLDGSGYNEDFCIDMVRKSRGHWGQFGLFMSNYELAPIM